MHLCDLRPHLLADARVVGDDDAEVRGLRIASRPAKPSSA